MSKIKFPQFQKGRDGIVLIPGLTILELIRKAGIKIHTDCNGLGICGKCVVRILKGEENLNGLTSLEKSFKLKDEERLACQSKILKDESDIVVYIKNFGEYEILKSRKKNTLPLNPLYYKKDGFVYKDGVIIDKYKGKIYGLALDIGTTTIVFDLFDMENGCLLKSVSITNPQISYGNDVISRIEYTLVDKKKGVYFEQTIRENRVKHLRDMVVEELNKGIKKISKEVGEEISKYIYLVVVAGNPVMRNIFFGIDVSSLGLTPYDTIEKKSISSSPEEIGVDMNKTGTIYGCPLIGGHIGADIVADILISGIYKEESLSLLIDIGTNGEIVLGNKNKMVATSCAAGGSFEGASVSCGVGAIEGAIKELTISDGEVKYSTIGGKSLIGICGSGLIDLLAELLEKKFMSRRAKIEEEFYVTDTLKLTQSDIFQLITSKAAIKTGWETLLDYSQVSLKDIKKVYLSGGFGNFINIKNAMKIGLIPKIDEDKVFKIGNGSIEGATEILLSKDKMALAEKIASKVLHIKTNEVIENFDLKIAENMYFE